MAEKTKVIIIGSGAAGLMAAKVLKEAGVEFIVLESTNHLGGRAQTLKRVPHIEFGPEFLHGETPLTDQLMEEFNLPYYDMKFDYHLYQQGKLTPLPDFWDRICGVLGEIQVPADDLPFAEYLEKFDHHSSTDQMITRSFVEGFDAADLNNISSIALKEMKGQACDPKIRKMRRPLNGYSQLMEKLAEDILPYIHFCHVVEDIIWDVSSATVKGVRGKDMDHFSFEADKVLNTVSVGVLKHLHMEPRPRAIDEFLEHVEMGQVVKMVAELDPEFFHLFKDHAFPFISSPELTFTAWWTTTPLHTYTVTAWAGGEKARALVEKPAYLRTEIFLEELSAVTFQPFEKIQEWTKHIHHKNWGEDPSFMGAYSYPKVMDGKKHKTVTEFEGTLYFAGEAFHEEFSGTIEGALLTGKDAAERMLASTELSEASTRGSKEETQHSSHG